MRKGSHHSDESKEKISKNCGMRRPEVRAKVANSQLGRIPWNKGKKGQIPWNKGIPQSEEAKRKNAASHIGKVAWNRGKKGVYSEDTIKTMKQSHKGSKGYWEGKKLTEEHKTKLSVAHLGQGYGRKLSEETKKKISDNHSGEKSALWRGGISFDPYCHKFNERLKEKIRKRDNHTCQLCGTKENGKKLSVHHIHYDRENCAPDLITLCNKCNSKVNFNRDYYEALFLEKLKNCGLLID